MTKAEIAEKIVSTLELSPYNNGIIAIRFQEEDWRIILTALQGPAPEPQAGRE